MKKFPNKTKFKKTHQVKFVKGNKGTLLNRFTVGVRLKSNKYLSFIQLETARRTMVKMIKPKERKNKKNQKNIRSAKTKKKGKHRKRSKSKSQMFIRSNLCQPMTKKPLQVRMGKGKGNVDHWVYPAKKCRVLFEMSRQHFKLKKIYRLFKKARGRLPSKIKFIFNRQFTRRETNFLLIKKWIKLLYFY